VKKFLEGLFSPALQALWFVSFSPVGVLFGGFFRFSFSHDTGGGAVFLLGTDHFFFVARLPIVLKK